MFEVKRERKGDAYKSRPFGRMELSGKDAERFIRHMHEDKPNPAAISSLKRGREIWIQMSQGEISVCGETSEELANDKN